MEWLLSYLYLNHICFLVLSQLIIIAWNLTWIYYHIIHFKPVSDWLTLLVLCGVPQGSILGSLLFLVYVNEMPQAVNSNLFLYVDDSCFMYQHRDVKEIQKQLNKDFENICDWFVNSKSTIHFGEGKTKYILFASKRKMKSARKLDYLCSLPIYVFIYLFIYLLICLSHLFILLFLTFILPIYHFLSTLSQSVLLYLLWIHFVISLCSYLAPTYVTLSLTRKNICNLIGLEEYNIGRICTLFSIFVLFD